MDGTKPRSNSGYYTDQGHQGTCYAHATTRMIARLIKVIFSPFFNEGEKCSELYVTHEDISNIYSKHGTWDKCKDEMLSALLFRFIYRIIVVKFRCNGGEATLSIPYVFTTIAEIKKESLKESLKFIKKTIEYNKIISKIHSIVIHEQIEELLKLLLSIIYVFANFILSGIIILKIVKKEASMKSLIKLLDRKYYAILSFRDHEMTITGYTKEFWRGVDLIVKNSHGENTKGFASVNDKGILTNFKFTNMRMSSSFLVESIEYIDPTITFNGNFVSYLKENVYAMLKQISDIDNDTANYTYTEPEKIVIDDIGLDPIVVNDSNSQTDRETNSDRDSYSSEENEPEKIDIGDLGLRPIVVTDSNSQTDRETNGDRDSYSSEENEPYKTAPDKDLPYDVPPNIVPPKKSLFSRLSRSASKVASRVGRALYAASAGKTKKNKRRTKRRKHKQRK